MLKDVEEETDWQYSSFFSLVIMRALAVTVLLVKYKNNIFYKKIILTGCYPQFYCLQLGIK
jgi:hypothetical protein